MDDLPILPSPCVGLREMWMLFQIVIHEQFGLTLILKALVDSESKQVG